jgi:hypothetical protein
MKINETIYTPFKNDIFNLYWLYPATFRIVVSEGNSWNQLIN